MKLTDFPGELQKNGDTTYIAKNVPNPSALVADYILVFSETEGLAKIHCLSPVINTGVYGEEVISEFKNIETALTKKYGNPKKYDLLSYGSIWKEPRDWMMGFVKKERTLALSWSSKNNKLPDNLTLIFVKVSASSSDRAYISISYEFDNFEALHKEIQKKKADGL